MKKISAFAAMMIFGFSSIALAQTAIKAEADKASITTDEDIVYKLTISTDEKNIPLPQLPKFAGFQVLSSARTSEIKFAKGTQKIGAVFVFVLAPTNTGKFKIEPSTIKIKNKVYSSESFEIEVVPGKRKPAPSPRPEEKPLPPESEEPQYAL